MPFFSKIFGDLSPAMRGFVVSLVMLTGGIPSIFAGQLADRFGRVVVLMLGAVVFTIGAALQAGAYHLPMFITGRALDGLGQGINYCRC